MTRTASIECLATGRLPILAIAGARVKALFAALVALVLGSCQIPEGELFRFEFTAPKMGTSFRLILYAHDKKWAEEAAARAFARVDQLDATFSDYDPESEASQLGQDARSVSEDLYWVLGRALELSAWSDGAFDVSVGPLTRLWRRALANGALPSSTEIAAARALVSWQAIVLDRQAHTVRLARPGMQLDFGGIAKGAAVDAALATLAASGIERALVAGGGDIAVGRAPPDHPGWNLVLETLDGVPIERITVVQAAVSTSGDRYQFLELDGTRYSHILDPRTGQALTRRIAASVIASDSTSADALATALCVLGPERGLALAQRCQAAARIVTLDAGDPVVHESPDFPRWRRRAGP